MKLDLEKRELWEPEHLDEQVDSEVLDDSNLLTSKIPASAGIFAFNGSVFGRVVHCEIY